MNKPQRKLVSPAAPGPDVQPQPSTGRPASAGRLRIAPFRFDVTPPLGHPLCSGLIQSAIAHDDALEAIGYVLLGPGAPVVVCAVDWTGILNQAHVDWRTTLATAAGTTPDRVAVQCVHQHNAPFVSFEAQAAAAPFAELPPMFDPGFFQLCLDRARQAVTAALPRARPCTHVAYAEARIENIASNRRVARDAHGHVTVMRGSSCKDPALQALPEGLIDPRLRTIAFYDGATKVVACHYYATHPMSYYGDGRVTSDFCGLARKQHQDAEPGCTHIYFTGCSGNIAAGKYNDGTPEARVVLTRRMADGIAAAAAGLRPHAIEQMAWRTREILPPPNPALAEAALLALVTDHGNSLINRARSAFQLAWLRRYQRGTPLGLSALRLNDISILHLPGEPFIDYQLRAQQIQPHRMVATAAYGDGGPWYIPTKEEYPHGGYEVSVAFCSDEVDAALGDAMHALLV